MDRRASSLHTPGSSVLRHRPRLAGIGNEVRNNMSVHARKGYECLCGFLSLLALLAMPIANATTAYNIAIVPQFTTVDIGMGWAPLLDRLHRETGVILQIRAAANIPEFEAEFLAGIPDLVFLNPYHMVMAAKAQGYRPLLRSSQPLEGILVASRSGTIKRLADLNGATLAFPAPNSFGASLYLRALLSEKEKISVTPVYVGTHQNVYRHVLLGDAQAGGGVQATLEREPAGVKRQLNELYRTPGSASHPLAAHPRVPKEVSDKIIRVLRRMALDPEGKKLLHRVGLSDAIPADYARDYAPLEKLKLDRHVVVEQK